MSSHQRFRRRVSFTPIMLTSKSMRPVERQQDQKNRQQRRYRDESFQSSNYKKQKHTFVSSMISQNEGKHLLKRKLQQDSSKEDLQQQNFKFLVRKMTSPTIVKVEFQRDSRMNELKRKLEEKTKNQEAIDNNMNIQQQSSLKKDESKKFMYFTTSKTYEQFTKLSKFNKKHKKVSYTPKEQIKGVSQQWSEYLQKYYLSVRKVRPLLQKQSGVRLLSPKKINNLTSNMQQKNQSTEIKCIHEQIQQGTKPKSISCNMIIKEREQTPPQSLIDQFDQSEVLRRIQQDVGSRKCVWHKKDHFVFGLSQTTTKASENLIKFKLDAYRDFLFKINFTNGLYLKSREDGDRPFKIFVGFGNNSSLVKGIMRRRYWWQLSDKISEDTNFIWTQLKISDIFGKQNKAQFEKSSKTMVLKPWQKKNQTRQQEIDTNKLNIENFNCNIMAIEDLRLWQKYAKRNKRIQEKGFDNCLSKRASELLKKKKMRFVQNPYRLKIHNHFQCNYFLGNKKALFYSLRKYYNLQNINPFKNLPLTFHISQGLADPQFDAFLVEYQKLNELRKKDKDLRNIWIVKPGELTNRGNGITVCATLDEIKVRLKSKQKNGNGTARTFIVQKYIEKPLLYNRRKFDIRHYMMMTCINGQIKGYWYSEGYIRTTSYEYNIKNCKDLYTHLTNDAVQKNSQDYGKYQKGNKLSYQEFNKYLSKTVAKNIDFYADILPKMKQLATDGMRSTYSILDPQRKEHNFELFGLDFMLDEDLNVYLIEVNTNPCLETSCPILSKVITGVIENLFKICVDPIFQPPSDWHPQRKFLLGDNAFEDNKFSLVFDENVDGHWLDLLYKNNSKIDEKMGDIFEQQDQYQDQQKEWNDQTNEQNKNVEPIKKP